uniref:Collagen_bind_2 domain-containing protein n=1 Tax=Panagrellus redivivus TaxID=6233 RepID=A0A7E4VDH7_PANRE
MRNFTDKEEIRIKENTQHVATVHLPESELSNDFKDIETRAVEARKRQKPSEIGPQPNKKLFIDHPRQLSAESSGKRRIKSVHETYLRAQKYEDDVDFVSAPPREWENWYITDWEGQVAFKAIHLPKRYVRASPEGNVDLVFTHPQAWELWSPFKNDNGTWSFQSHHGQWLSADADGRACIVEKKQDQEQFLLENWD